MLHYSIRDSRIINMMYLKLLFLCIINAMWANGFGIFSINRRLMEELDSIGNVTGAPISTHWIEQKVDHFNATDTRTWKMKYFERLDYWKPNGPIYLFMGGIRAPLKTGMLYELAKETKGAMFMSEQRYYGESQPIPVNRSKLNIEDLKFLSTPQTLADNAMLIKNIKNKNQFRNSKVVVVGGFYGGNLAAWMKLIYPDLIDAAIASSSPVLAKRDFYEYLEVVNKDYEKFGTPGCIEKIRKIFQRYDLLFQTEEGIKKLKEEKNICEESDLTKPENKALFFVLQTSMFMQRAQYGYTSHIKEHCSELNGTHNTLVHADEIYNWNEQRHCFDVNFDDFIQCFHHKRSGGALFWVYQLCTEFGYFQSSSSDNHPFTKNIPVEWYDKMCTALFGVDFDKNRVNNGVEKINNMYGGKSPNVTNVVFVNGELDPWSALGVLKDISNDAPAIYIPESSHCSDLYSDEDEDPKELKEARVRIKNLIKKWISVSDYIAPTIP